MGAAEKRDAAKPLSPPPAGSRARSSDLPDGKRLSHSGSERRFPPVSAGSHVLLRTAPAGEKPGCLGVSVQQPGMAGFLRKIKKSIPYLHEIWYTDLTADEANALEIEMIKKYNSANREFGYNIDLGGNQTGKVSEETKRKHRENQLGEKSHWYGKTGALNPMFGKKMSEEQKEYRRILQTGKKHTEESKMKMSQNHHAKRKVVCVDTGEVFDSITIAANAKGINSRHISEVCTGKLKTTGGLRWEYYEGGENE